MQLEEKDTISVIDDLMREVQKMPAGLMSALTWDRGSELAQHKRFTLATKVEVYFCDSRVPWQRGTNENTNGLLRQYFLMRALDRQAAVKPLPPPDGGRDIRWVLITIQN